METIFSDVDTLSEGRILNLNADHGDEYILESVTKALSSETRLAILDLLGKQTCSVLYIAEVLNLPQSTATLHVNILERAGLIKTDLQPARRGLQKLCARTYDRIIIQLPTERKLDDTTVNVSMPIGGYVEATVMPTCGLAGDVGLIGQMDDPISFYEPERIYAQLLWFRSGHVEYRFPNRQPIGTELQSLELTFEACSEAPLHHSRWPSDVTLWINGVEIGTWTYPADFGGERGSLTPSWWDNNNSQYGLLKTWQINQQGCTVDGEPVSAVTLSDLIIEPNETISVSLGVKGDARNVGGLNLFGSRFGNYPQDIMLKQFFRRNGTGI